MRESQSTKNSTVITGQQCRAQTSENNSQIHGLFLNFSRHTEFAFSVAWNRGVGRDRKTSNFLSSLRFFK